MEIFRCDRCKCLIENYIPIVFTGINKNTKIEDDGKEEQDNNFFNMFALPHNKYENHTWQLCKECAEGILHWLGHSENKLKKVRSKK